MRTRALAAVAVLLALLVYLGALGVPFLFDDRHTVLDNPSIRDLSNLRWIFIGSRRFVTNFSYAADWALWDAQPFGFHLTNVILHALAVLALFALARRLLRDDFAAFTAAALFAVHPLGSESVAYVSSRAGLLCTLFLLTSTWAWHRALTGRRAFMAVAIVCWILAAASKETGLLAPFLWAACDLLFIEGGRARLKWYLAFGAVALLAAGWRIGSYLLLESRGTHHSSRLVQAEVFWRYVFLCVAPVGQSLIHSVPPPSAGAWLGLVGLGMALVILWQLHRTRPAAAFGGLWFLALLAPSSLLPLMQPMAEHRVYESCAGAALLVAACIPRRKLLTGALVVALATLTLLRVQLWRSPVALWGDAAHKAPHEWLARYGFADALREAGDCRRAIEEYTAAIAERPAEPRARRNRAICQALLGRYEEAEAELLSQLASTPNDPTLHYNLGVLESQRGRQPEAKAYWLRALALDPNHWRACQDLRQLFPGESCRQPR